MLDPTPALRLWASRRLRVLAGQDAAEAQRRTLMQLVRTAAGTAFGRAHGFADIRSPDDFRSRVPLRTWDDFWGEWWQKPFPHLHGATWPGPIRAFAKTSGTTSGASKHIPVSPAMRRSNHGTSRDLMAFHLARRPDSRLLAGPSVLLGGSTTLDRLAPGVVAADLSGLAAAALPLWARGRVLPPPTMASLGDWREKMAQLVPLALRSPVTSLSGAASWLLLFCQQASALRGGALLADLFPHLEMIVHGAVGFAPYRDHFAQLLAGSAAYTREAFAASEGFFAFADRGDGEGMRLVLDRGLFFEFVRPADLGSNNPDRRWVADAELGVDYAMVLTTNAGLWSYVIGDTVRLVSRNPPRLLITGRTTWMLSVAGEHLTAAELDAAMTEAAAAQGRRVADFSAAPIQPDDADRRGGHLFAIELDAPADAAVFGRALDGVLARMNDDYAAHRSAGFGLRDPDIRLLPPATFTRWMEQRGKLGGQNKVPRVVPDAAALAGLLAMAPAPPATPPSPPGSGPG